MRMVQRRYHLTVMDRIPSNERMASGAPEDRESRTAQNTSSQGEYLTLPWYMWDKIP
jgi:hypothetical protein